MITRIENTGTETQLFKDFEQRRRRGIRGGWAGKDKKPELLYETQDDNLIYDTESDELLMFED